MSQLAIAYLSQHKLHILRGGETSVLESEYARAVSERAASIERRHAWKSQGRGAMFLGAWAPAVAGAPVQPPALMTGLSTLPDGCLLYSMETTAVSGLFLRDPSGLETRLFHTADYRISQISADKEGAMLAASVFHAGGPRSNIAVLPVRGADFREITEGDSFDEAPQWVPGAARRVVFQTAGVGRNAAGQCAGYGPSSIQQIDLDTGYLQELAAEDGQDLLQPRMTTDGALYYIRRPYRSWQADASLWGALRDTALFPFRMGRALFQYFNVFSMMYSGKPLVTRKGAVQRAEDPRQMLIHGNMAQVLAQPDEAIGQSLVPASWELMRRAPSGTAAVVAKCVLSYDLPPDGSVLWTNGSAISRIAPDCRQQRLSNGQSIARVIAL